MCCIYFLIYRFEVLGFIKNSGATLNKESARRTVVIVVVVGGGGGGFSCYSGNTFITKEKI